MMNNNKILTVSYGTFSCTLEGFDDSFGTMKAIAEYFRDLAADDRYFGAEPPQPDAEMLARIAEREISRRVEAREQEGRIVLSAEAQQPDASAASPMALAAVTAAAPVAAAVAQDAAEEAEVEAPAEEAPAEDATQVEETVDMAQADDVAEEAEAEDVTEAVAEIPAAEAEDAAAEDVADDAAADDAVEVVEAEEFFAQSQPDTPPVEAELVEDDAPAAPVADAAPDSIAAKLQRIRAVVSQSQEEAEEDEMFEDEHADAFSPAADIEDLAEDAKAEDTPETVLESAAQDIEAALADDEENAAVDQDEDALADLLARFEGDADDADVQTEAGADVADDADAELADAVNAEAAQDDADDLGLDTLAALMAEDDDQPVAAEDKEENIFDDADAADMDAADEAPVEAAEMAEANDDMVAETEADAADDDVAEADTQEPQDDAPAMPRARVIKVKRADIDAAIASGALEEVSEPVEDTTLSAEDEAELMAELAEVEAELPATDDTDADDADAVTAEAVDDEVADQADAEPEAETVADVEEEAIADAEADATEGTDAVKDDDVQRLMAEADNQMEEPEGSRRRNAFQHLKAAVMAKKADAGIGKKDAEEEGAFRSDLAEVVKPRRPEARGDSDQRPGSDRPAPLKLVAEQRVDVDTAPKGPVTPRRVAAMEEAAAEDAGSFAEYANEMGAHDLPALLEAAASYLSFVEGRDEFSRPQLMTKVRQVEKDDFSREDGLRSFGQLLRAGKIEKIKGGRFAVTGDIGYRPDQREAG